MSGMYRCNVPVAFLIFNRPETTQKVFKEIRNVQPPKLLIVADGPRSDRTEVERCNAARAIVDQIDWPCEILKNYSTDNLGCRRRISSGLDWVFKNVEEAIILEDDCLPHPSFFRFCEELLNRYRDDERVMMISGDNFQFGRRQKGYSYYFSLYTHIWGWASWSRAWKQYDVDMRHWALIPDRFNWLKERVIDRRSAAFWEKVFNAVSSGDINTWDFQWTFSCWLHNGLAIMPDENLISNIGFSEDATHTSFNSPYASMPTVALEFPLTHPPLVMRDFNADRRTQRTHYNPGIIRIIFTLLSALFAHPHLLLSRLWGRFVLFYRKNVRRCL